MLVQGVWGYRVADFAAWRYRRTPLVVLHLAGAVLLGLAWLRPVFPLSAAAIILLGLYLGYAYFAAVYYASNSGRRSLNIGVNECLVGLGSFAGLFGAQWGESLAGRRGGMFAVCAVALLASLLVQVALASRGASPAAEPLPAAAVPAGAELLGKRPERAIISALLRSDGWTTAHRAGYNRRHRGGPAGAIRAWRTVRRSPAKTWMG